MRRRARKPVVDGLAEALVRHPHHGDGGDVTSVKRAEVGKQVGRGLDQVAARRQVENDRGMFGAGRHSGAEGEQGLAGIDAVHLQAKPRARCVMGFDHAGRDRRVRIERARRRVLKRFAEHRFDLLARQAAGPQQHGTVETADDGGLDADRCRPAIDDEVDAAAEIVHHVLRGGRRNVPGAVGGGRNDRPAEPVQEAERDRMLRHPHGDAVEARRRKLGHRAAGALLQHQGQRPRPECRGELLGRGVEHREALGGGEIEHMRDQRIERRPALGGIKPRDGGAVGGVGAEAVDGFGRKRDQAAVGKAERRVGDGDEVRGSQPCFDRAAHFFFRFCGARLAAAVRGFDLPDFLFAASTLIQSRLRSPSMFCSRSNSRAIALGRNAASAAGISRASRRGRAAAPACP